jgi:hypothetical protein
LTISILFLNIDEDPFLLECTIRIDEVFGLCGFPHQIFFTETVEVYMSSRYFWYVMMAGAIIGWLFALSGLIAPFTDETVRLIWLIVLIVWVVGHPLELPISLPIGEKAGLSKQRTVIKTILFGFTWWLPVKLGVFKE